MVVFGAVKVFSFGRVRVVDFGGCGVVSMEGGWFQWKVWCAEMRDERVERKG